MKLGKAIEVCDNLLTDGPHWPPRVRRPALKLLIEAGKRIIAWRDNNDETLLWDLPSETEK